MGYFLLDQINGSWKIVFAGVLHQRENCAYFFNSGLIFPYPLFILL